MLTPREATGSWVVETTWTDGDITTSTFDDIDLASITGRLLWCASGVRCVRVAEPSGAIAFTVGPNDSRWLAHTDAARAREAHELAIVNEAIARRSGTINP